MGISHRNDVAIFTTFRPNHDHQPLAYVTGGGDPLLAIIEPVIDKLEDRTFDHRVGIGKVQPAFGERLVALGGVEGGSRGKPGMTTGA